MSRERIKKVQSDLKAKRKLQDDKRKAEALQQAVDAPETAQLSVGENYSVFHIFFVTWLVSPASILISSRIASTIESKPPRSFPSTISPGVHAKEAGNVPA
jgi:hypothetical protein